MDVRISTQVDMGGMIVSMVLQENRAKVLALLHRMQDSQLLIETLTSDILHILTNPMPGDDAASRRAYVRSVFALIEGGISAMSALILEGQETHIGGWELKEADRVVLWDSVPDPSGERPEGGRATLVQRAKTVFKAGGRVFAQPPPADFGGEGFQAFRRAVMVRDRLMHPKRSADLIVTDDDMRDMAIARDWFRGAAKILFESVAARVRSLIESRR